MRPTDCRKCRDYFLGNPLLQAEMRHMAVKFGAGVAEAELNERLEERHLEHSQPTHREDADGVS